MSPARRRKRVRNAPAPLPGFTAASVDFKVNLHGMRVREALIKLDRHIRTCHAANAPVVHVIHGHGTGALKTAVRTALADHELVDKSYPAGYGMGGDGVTIAELNNGDRYATRRKSHDNAPVPKPDRRY